MQVDVVKRTQVDADEIRLTLAGLQLELLDDEDSVHVNVAVRDTHALTVTLYTEGATLLAEQGYGVHVAQGESAVLFASAQGQDELLSEFDLPEGTPGDLVSAHAALTRAQTYLDKLAGANVDTKAHAMLVTAAQLLQDAESLAQTLAERREQDESQDTAQQ